MNNEIIKLWDNGKENLRNYLRTHNQSEYVTYEKLVKILIQECLNYNKTFQTKVFSDKIDISDHGEGRGVQIFLLHKEKYSPEVDDYYIFDNEYGSCSACDNLLRINEYKYDLPTEEQINQYMTLCLHMCQRIKCLNELCNN